MDKQLKKIQQSTLRFLYPVNAQELYQIIIEEAVKLVNAKYGSVVLEENDELKRVYSTMPLAGQYGFRKNGFTMKAFTSNTAFITPVSQRKDVRKNLKDFGIKTTIFIPLSNRGQSIGVLIINSEKEQKYTEEELEILELFGAIASMAIRKTQVYEEMEQALKVRDLFISMAAHELRTPLTTINGYIQLLQNKIPQNNSPESRWLYELHRESTRLTELVHELLEVNRIRSGQLNYVFKEYSLKDIISRALRNFSLTHSSRTIEFEDETKSDNPMIIGDFDKLLQVITNLVDNAVKFSPTQSTVIIRLREKGSTYHIYVIDQGVGIPKNDLPYVFNDFYRGENHKREGIGLGLYLIKNIITQHNGSIKISSKLHKGTIFEVILPKISH